MIMKKKTITIELINFIKEFIYNSWTNRYHYFIYNNFKILVNDFNFILKYFNIKRFNLFFIPETLISTRISVIDDNILSKLMYLNFDINGKNLWSCCYYEKYNCAKILINNGVEVTENMLLDSIHFNNFRIVKLLLKSGFDIYKPDKYGKCILDKISKEWIKKFLINYDKYLKQI